MSSDETRSALTDTDVDVDPLHDLEPPVSIEELLEEVRRGIWKEGRPLIYWLNKANKFIRVGDQALKIKHEEEAFVFLSKAAVLIMELIPTHPEIKGYNDVQRGNLVKNGTALLPKIKELKERIMKRYTDWEKEEAQQRAIREDRELLGAIRMHEKERAEKRERELNLAKGEAVVDFAPQPLPSHVAKTPISPNLKAIRLKADAYSRPSSPIPAGAADELFTAIPSTAGSSSPTNSGDDDVPPTYEEVMSLPPKDTWDGGSDYNIEVVAPDPLAGGLSPLPVSLVALPSDRDEKKEKKVEELPAPYTHTDTPTPLSRVSSVSKGKKREKQKMVVHNAGDELDDPDMRDVEVGLDAIYEKLGSLRLAGVPLSENVRRKLEGLTQFLNSRA